MTCNQYYRGEKSNIYKINRKKKKFEYVWRIEYNSMKKKGDLLLSLRPFVDLLKFVNQNKLASNACHTR